MANFFCNFLFIFRLFDIEIGGIVSRMIEVSWLASMITALLTIFFLIRYIRDIYKLSLRGDYRTNYLKLL